MILQSLSLFNYKNIAEANLSFSSKINCFVGLNAQGKTNIFDAIYLLSFTKSAFNTMDAQNIRHNEQMAWIEGIYTDGSESTNIVVSCSLRIGHKKQFRVNKKLCTRMMDHIGTIPLVLVTPEDNILVDSGSDERRKFMDIAICQNNKSYLRDLMQYNALLKQRNALLKKYNSQAVITDDDTLLEVLEEQMIPLNESIFEYRKDFVKAFIPFFQQIYNKIAGEIEKVDIVYISQLHTNDIRQSFKQTRERDKILGWTSRGIHKDDLGLFLLDPNTNIPYNLKRTGSQGQQKTFIFALKLAQMHFLQDPILLLDDIFDKLDSDRVHNIVDMILDDHFGQIFITDTNRQHLTELIPAGSNAIFHVENGNITY